MENRIGAHLQVYPYNHVERRLNFSPQWMQVFLFISIFQTPFFFRFPVHIHYINYDQQTVYRKTDWRWEKWGRYKRGKYPSKRIYIYIPKYCMYVCMYIYIHGENVSNNNNPDSRGFNTYLDLYPHIIIAPIWDTRLRILSNGTCFYAITFLVNGLYNILL